MGSIATQYPSDTYKRILLIASVGVTSAGISKELKPITCGDGNDSTFLISTDGQMCSDSSRLFFRDGNSYINSDSANNLQVHATRFKMAANVSCEGRMSMSKKLLSVSNVSAPKFVGTSASIGTVLATLVSAADVKGAFIGNLAGNSIGTHVGSVSLKAGKLSFYSPNDHIDAGTNGTIKYYFNNVYTMRFSASGIDPQNSDYEIGKSNPIAYGRFTKAVVGTASVGTGTWAGGTINNTSVGATTAAAGRFTTLGLASTLNMNSKEIHMVSGGNVKLKYYSTGIRALVGAASIYWDGTRFAPVANNAYECGGKTNSWSTIFTTAASVLGGMTVGGALTVDKYIGVPNMPTASADVSTGQLYNASGTVKIKIG
jgi:hypothetical protein